VSQDQTRPEWQKKARGKSVKIGHGGTLDPLATGVLVVGVGRGTKGLMRFLGCTKTYETVVLFGKSTDTYDVAGRIAASADFKHVTKVLVEQKLTAFRGKIKQVPPIYSSLKIDGIKGYEYARTGKGLPRELTAREMEVHECELLDWFDGGKHEYRWPATELSVDEKSIAMPLNAVAHNENPGDTVSPKRKRCEMLEGSYRETDEAGSRDHKRTKLSPGDETCTKDRPLKEGSQSGSASAEESSTIASSNVRRPGLSHEEKARLHTHEIGPLSAEICSAPAARVKLTVSSGFYVRSFAHDLGIACDSFALMASLNRSRQAEFDSKSALDYNDLAHGEQLWGPKLQGLLDDWNEKHPEETKIDDRGRAESPGGKYRIRSRGHIRTAGMKNNRSRGGAGMGVDRRNTSSAEE
jgi:tRNA pseudouridine55 synthase